MKYIINVKFLLVVFLSLFIHISRVDADLCDNEHIKQLKELAKQVEVNYEYIDNSDEMDSDSEFGIVTNAFRGSINLISDELYINFDGRDYYYSDTVDGILELGLFSGMYKYEIKSKKCANYLLRKDSIVLPEFNSFSYNSECKELEEYNLDVCDPWYQGKINNNIFYEEVNKYLLKDEMNFFEKIFDFLGTHYLIVGGSLMLIILVIIGIIIHRKRSVLE